MSDDMESMYQKMVAQFAAMLRSRVANQQSLVSRASGMNTFITGHWRIFQVHQSGKHYGYATLR